MFNIETNTAYYCRSKKEAKYFLSLAKKAKIKWLSGDELNDNDSWEFYLPDVAFILTERGLGYCDGTVQLPREEDKRDFVSALEAASNVVKRISFEEWLTSTQTKWLFHYIKNTYKLKNQDALRTPGEILGKYLFVTDKNEAWIVHGSCDNAEAIPDGAIPREGEWWENEKYGASRVMDVDNTKLVVFSSKRSGMEVVDVGTMTKTQAPECTETFSLGECFYIKGGDKERLWVVASVQADIIRDGVGARFPKALCVKLAPDDDFDIKIDDYVRLRGYDNRVYQVVAETYNSVYLEGDTGNRWWPKKTSDFAKITDALYVCWAEEAQKETPVLSETELEQIVDTMESVFEDTDYNYTDEAVTKMAKKWAQNKSKLAKVLRKADGWDEKNLCVVRDITVEQRNASRAKKAYLALIYNVFCCSPNDTPSSRLLADMYSESSLLSDAASGALSQESRAWLVANLERQGFTVKFSLNVGAKFSRVINAVLRAVIEQAHFICPEYEKSFAAFSDGIKNKPEKLKFVLSIHPADYMRMSFGNSWDSCHKLGKGCYQAGTLSYMLDTCSMVGYVVKPECKDEHWKEGKIFRQMFMYNGAEMLKSRLYPDYSTNDAIYGTAFADCVAKILDIPSDWKKINTSLTTMAQGKGSVAYPDFTFSSYNTWSLVNPKYRADCAFIAKTTPIGEPPMCPICGKEHGRKNSCYCNDCGD